MHYYADLLSDFTSDLRFEGLPNVVVERAKQLVMDLIGVCFASSQVEYCRAVVDVIKSLGGEPQSTIIGHRNRVSAPNAAFANGVIAHSLDYDDTHLEAVMHLSSVIIPTALALGERLDASGKTVIEASVAGYETAARVGMAASGEFHRKGFHATSVCGVLGAVVTASKLLGLGSQKIADAMGLSGSMASGLLEFLSDGSWVKPIHPGWAAHSGIMASLMAQKGLTGPHSVLEGRCGIYNAFLSGNFEGEKLTRGLGEVWETLNISVKPYPACHLAHSFMDAALELKKEHNLRVDEIREVECVIPKLIVDVVCEPVDEKLEPKTPYGAKFSLPFAVATVLLKGRAAIDDFRYEGIRNEQVLKLARRVTYVVDGNSEYPRSPYIPGLVRIRTNDGSLLEHKLRYNRGSPQNPMSQAELKAKFMDNCTLVLSSERAEAVADAILTLDGKKTLTELMATLAEGLD